MARMERAQNPGLRSRLMILALRILYFEDLSVGMTDFASMHDGA